MVQEEVSDIIDNIFKEWYESKHPSKAFIFLIRNFKYFPGQKDHAMFLEAYYALMRGIDNYVDGDVAIPNGLVAAEFIVERITFTEALRENPSYIPKHPYDRLIKYCMELGDRFNHNFYDETLDILNSMLFDAKRRVCPEEELKIFSRQDLYLHFFELDIRGTIRGNLKAFGENPHKFRYLEPLGTATRIWFNLRDLAEDLAVGYVNISIEEMEEFGIGIEDLSIARTDGLRYIGDAKTRQERYYLSLPSSIKRWMVSESYKGMQLLDKHTTEFKKGDFNMISRLYCPLVYGIHAKKYFNRVLQVLND